MPQARPRPDSQEPLSELPVTVSSRGSRPIHCLLWAS